MSKLQKALSAIKSSYCCSGTIQDIGHFKIFYSNSGKCNFIRFPNPHSSQIHEAIKNSKISRFGTGNKNGDEYKAHEIQAQNLGILSEFSNIISNKVCPIVKDQLNIKAAKIQPRLLSLDIYEKGCYFKGFVNSLNSFGSLVVFLPCYFEGGELIVSQGRNKTNFCFGNKQYKQIDWVAFFKGCQQRIEEVKAGYRLTLSYDLFQDSKQVIQTTPNKQISKVIINLKQQKTYAYYCEHFYGNGTLKQIPGQQSKILKGKDSLLWNSCVQLKLNVRLHVLIHSDSFDQKGSYFTKPSNIQEGGQYQLDLSRIESSLLATRIENYQQIIWLNGCDNSKYRYAINGYLGNEHSEKEHYCRLVMVINT